MSAEDERIRKDLRDFFKKDERIFTADVINVDEQECVIDVVTVRGTTLYNVKLKALHNNAKGVIVFPKINSTVQVCRIGDKDFIMLAADEVEKVLWSINGVTCQIDGDGVVIDKNGDSLKDILTLITEAVQKIIVLQGTNPDRIKLQQALTKINNLFQ